MVHLAENRGNNASVYVGDNNGHEFSGF